MSHIKKKIGSPPRKFGLIDKLFKLRIIKPDWDWKSEEISKTVVNWEKVFHHGHLAWGQIIQVNTLLFEEGNENCPGELLIDPFPDENSIEKLQMIANHLYSLKGNSNQINDLESKEFAQYLENQLIRVYGLKVPKDIGSNDNLFVSTVYFQRKHLMRRKIMNGLIPVLYLNEDPKVVVMVPYQYWSDHFKEWWEE